MGKYARRYAKRHGSTLTEDKAEYSELIAAARAHPDLSKKRLGELFDLSPAIVSQVINRADALAQELGQPQREAMAREWRLSFFRLAAMEEQLATSGLLNPGDAQRLAIAKGICQDKVNIQEGLPSDITLNIDIIRGELPEIGRRIIEGARIAGMLPPASKDGNT